MNVLFVCTGNTCRSPMAEQIARARAAEQGLGTLSFRSAGIFAPVGSAASEGARVIAEQHGLSLEGHRATQVSAELLGWADVVLAMGPRHLEALARWARDGERGGEGAASTLLSTMAQRGMAPPHPEDPGVPDPFGGSLDLYRETWESLESMIEEVLGRLARSGEEAR